MAAGSHRRFVDWEERFVSHDRGSRVVHYYLRDRHGHQCLAVIGTERSLRHMVYVVCDDFLPFAGLDKSTTSAFKWRARREVVDWLSSFLTRIRSPDALFSTGSPKTVSHQSTDAESAFSHDGVEGPESGQEECRSRHSHVWDNDARKQFSVSKADVVWVGSAWSCRKRLRHFHSFQRNGITISVLDFVYVMTEEKDRHIAYVEDLFEDKKQRKKLRVRWFHKTSELTCRIPPPVPHNLEVFYTAFQQDLSVECVDGVATVLTPEHHEVCLAALPAESMAQALMCYRQFDNEGIKPFNIQEVKGYWHQTVLSLAGLGVSRETSPHFDQGSEDLDLDEEEGADPGRLIRRGPRTARCSRRRTGYGSRMVRPMRDLTPDTSCMSGEHGGSGCGDGKYVSSSGGRMEGANSSLELWRYDVGDHIEILSEDSGLRGCWFKGTVLRRAMRRLKVRYDDIQCEDGKENLEEWIPSCRIAAPCKLGIRISGRPCIRPPPPEGSSSLRFNEGEVVDAWWHDGWWEGIFCGRGSSGLMHVYIPGEQETAALKQTDLRASREWLIGNWAAMPSYPDVVMLLGLSCPTAKEVEQTKVEQRLRHICENSLPLQPGHTITQERCGLAANEVRQASVLEARSQNQPAREPSTIIDVCSISAVKYEQVSVPEVRTASECVDEGSGSLNEKSGSRAGSGVDHTVAGALAHLFHPEHHDDSASSEGKESQLVAPNVSSKPSSTGLKWKVGRKRHRQGDLVTSRVDRNSNHTINEGKTHSPESMQEEVHCDRNKADSILQEDVENQHRWTNNGEAEDLIKPKKHRQGNDSSLKSLHGPPMGGSLFISSIPIANLVMSR